MIKKLRYFTSIILFLLIPNLSYTDDRLAVKKSYRKFKISSIILLSPIARFDVGSKSFDTGIEKSIGINISYPINYNIGLFNWSLK
ncbi:MAG: hypothetical protein C4617_05760 [Candidatus Liberibacter europaeus]|uniref:Uncharacterized protein n=1 Tax=Candidatus Liberibacter europaeus TaxID=744859 RepID=A0A2T4VWA7_9HYPH|nr:hypothetical protein [Candidatus Liberibacter europaeus]PTL86057.1 MAG: hypothetical protein C4617_05760 [Candidatus Liberibacter europaeus]